MKNFARKHLDRATCTLALAAISAVGACGDDEADADTGNDPGGSSAAAGTTAGGSPGAAGSPLSGGATAVAGSPGAGGAGGADCPPGTETCPCRTGGECDPGLNCASGLCVDLGTVGGAGGMVGSAGAGGAVTPLASDCASWCLQAINDGCPDNDCQGWCENNATTSPDCATLWPDALSCAVDHFPVFCNDTTERPAFSVNATGGAGGTANCGSLLGAGEACIQW